MKTRLLAALLAMNAIAAAAQPGSGEVQLRTRIQEITETADAAVGVALIVDGRDTLTVGDGRHYPLMSVMKLHQAVAVCRLIEERGLTLQTETAVAKEDLKSGTWSPLRDKYPEGGISLSAAELLRLTLQQSDNNACDIIFDRFAGPPEVDSLLRTMGLTDFAISATEDEMHRNPDRCLDNWSTPLSAATLMDRLARGDLPLDRGQLDFLRQTLLGCDTGQQRLPLPLQGTDARTGHKTGTSDRGADGRWTGINDVGFVLLPDGRLYTLAVFVADSGLSMEESEKLIADISAAVYEALRHD